MFKRLLIRATKGFCRHILKAAFLIVMGIVVWYTMIRPSYLPRLNDLREEGNILYHETYGEDMDSAENMKDSVRQLQLNLMRYDQESFYMGLK